MKNLLFLAIIVIGTSSCKNIKMPEYVKMENLNLAKLNFSEGAIHLNIKFKNTNDFGVEAKDIDLKISMDGKDLGNAESTSKISIPKNSEFTIPIKVSFEPQTVLSFAMKNLAKFNSDKPFEMKANGSMKIGKGGVFVLVPIDVSQQMNLKSMIK